MNARLQANLIRSMVQRCPRAVRYPARAITAPESVRRDHTDEADRLAYFEQSAATRGGVVAPFARPAAASEPPTQGAVAGFFSSQPEFSK